MAQYLDSYRSRNATHSKLFYQFTQCHLQTQVKLAVIKQQCNFSHSWYCLSTELHSLLLVKKRVTAPHPKLIFVTLPGKIEQTTIKPKIFFADTEMTDKLYFKINQQNTTLEWNKEKENYTSRLLRLFSRFISEHLILRKD